MTKETQKPWPNMTKGPYGCFMQPDGKQKSERLLAGPLRLGTEPRVGPRGATDPGGSDMGMDYLSTRRFDPIGTHDERSPPREKSTFISREIRRK